MAVRQWRPSLSADFAATARAHVLDLALAALLFVGASLAAGRVWRFPFDDEVGTLSLIENHSTFDLVRLLLDGGDVHPPLAYLVFHGLHQLGLDEAAMRACSLAMTAVALALFHLLSLSLIMRRNGGTIRLSTRLIAVMVFGLSPLALGQGDALRWYPLFAVLTALFVTLYLVGGNATARLISAMALGLAASTNFLAVVVTAAFVLYRYLLERQWRSSFDIPYWLVVAVFASGGIATAYSILTQRFGVVAYQVGAGVIQSVLTDVLGFFGGYAVGISQAWIVVPAALIAAAAAFSEADRRNPAAPIHLLLLMLVTSAALALIGFSKARSFLYLAPPVAVIVTLFLDRLMRRGATGAAMTFAMLMLVASIATVATINAGTRPFKRNLAVPYQVILDFVQANERGSVLVVSTDPVVPWELGRGRDAGARCTSYFLGNAACFEGERRYDSIFIVTGFNARSADATFMQRFRKAVDDVTASRRKAATLLAGVDEDAGLKSRLTGVPLDRHTLTVDWYQ